MLEEKPAMNALLLIALPYASIAVFVAGMIWRYRSRVTITSRSSFLLERRWLLVGAIPFHLGIALLFLGHLLPLLIPNPWRALVSDRRVLLTVETIGSAAAILCIAGLTALFVRRFVPGFSRRRSSRTCRCCTDRAGRGRLGVAVMHRWGAVVRRHDHAVPAALSRCSPSWRCRRRAADDDPFAGVALALIPFTRPVHLTFPLRSSAAAAKWCARSLSARQRLRFFMARDIVRRRCHTQRELFTRCAECAGSSQ
jgi:hypothetical protein